MKERKKINIENEHKKRERKKEKKNAKNFQLVCQQLNLKRGQAGRQADRQAGRLTNSLLNIFYVICTSIWFIGLTP